MQADVWLVGASYSLGEQYCEYTRIDNCEAMFAERNIPFVPELLGLVGYYKTADAYRLASDSIRKTLLAANVGAASIDCVIVSSSNFRHEFMRQNRALAQVFRDNGLKPKAMYCVCGTGCVALLSSLELASGMVAASNCSRVLVVNVDHLDSGNDRDRFVDYAVVSDSASSAIIISGQEPVQANSKIVCFGKSTDTDEMLSGIRGDRFDNGLAAIGEMRSRANIELSKIEKIFSNNIFLPFKKNKERRLGFGRDQLYLANTTRVGHCLAADSLINLVDYTQANAGRSRLYLLYSEADGHAASVLLAN